MSYPSPPEGRAWRLRDMISLIVVCLALLTIFDRFWSEMQDRNLERMLNEAEL